MNNEIFQNFYETKLCDCDKGTHISDTTSGQSVLVMMLTHQKSRISMVKECVCRHQPNTPAQNPCRFGSHNATNNTSTTAIVRIYHSAPINHRYLCVFVHGARPKHFVLVRKCA